jgi:hypothetical protein
VFAITWRRVYFHGGLARGETAEVRILLPKVGFDEFRCSHEAKNHDISFGQSAPFAKSNFPLLNKPAPTVATPPASTPFLRNDRHTGVCTVSYPAAYLATPSNKRTQGDLSETARTQISGRGLSSAKCHAALARAAQQEIPVRFGDVGKTRVTYRR